MSAPNPKRQKAARSRLNGLFGNLESVCVIHYSCESFYDRKESGSPRITSIALRNLTSSQTRSFSIHQVAEVKQIPLDGIEAQYDVLEREMLEDFFSYISGFRNTSMKYLHWNMRDVNYGFQALEHRYRVLTGDSTSLQIVHDRDKVDLSRLLYDIYGPNYTDHPRLVSLVTRGGTIDPPRHFLTGAQEADAFEKHDFVALHQSTLKKVDVIANLAVLANEGKLKTNTTWWQMRGGNVITFANWLGVHPIFALVIGLFSTIGVLATLAVIGLTLFGILT